MRFKKKWELLEYLGLDKKYVRKIDRMMIKGEVCMVDGEYEYNNPALELEKEVKGLREEVERLKGEKNELFFKLMDWDKSSVKESVIKDSEMIEHLSYIYERLMMRENVINEFIKQFFEKNRLSYDYDSAVQEVYNRFNYVEDADEKAELDFIKWLIEWKQ